ncbi:MAG: type II secretion system F family protein [Patescibacteria group bacterium]|nr:type II secretion system F family protein [Patescibacteria group bacterium]
MPKFTYLARDNQGNIKRGELIAPNEASLAKALRSKGLLLTHAESDVTKKTIFKKDISGLFGKITTTDKILFTRNMQVMIKAGLPISKALEILVKQTSKKNFKAIISDISSNVQKGKSFADSLALYPKIFPPLFINMIKVGEIGGELEKVLDQLATQMKKDSDLLSNIKSAMIYPVIILTLMIAVIIVMIIFVLPELANVFRDIQADLPLTTRMIIGFSDFISKYGIYVAIGIVLIGAIIYIILKSKEGRRKFHKLLLVIPILGINVKKVNLARFARTMSTLLTSGVPIVDTLKITGEVLGNTMYREAILSASNDIKKGLRIVEVLDKNKNLFPPLVTQMVAVGEETGNLDSILKDVAEFYEADVTRTTENLASIIEPILMITLGIGVAVMAIAIVSPIYSMMEKI